MDDKKRMVPRIRFRGFGNAWEQRKLGEISKSFSYGMNSAAKKFDGINKYIRITDIDEDSNKLILSNIKSPSGRLDDAYLLLDGDILFARTGASVGKTFIYTQDIGKAYFAGFLIRQRTESKYDPKFIFQQTLTRDCLKTKNSGII